MIHYDIEAMWTDRGFVHVVSLMPEGRQEHILSIATLAKLVAQGGALMTETVMYRLTPGHH